MSSPRYSHRRSASTPTALVWQSNMLTGKSHPRITVSTRPSPLAITTNASDESPDSTSIDETDQQDDAVSERKARLARAGLFPAATSPPRSSRNALATNAVIGSYRERLTRPKTASLTTSNLQKLQESPLPSPTIRNMQLSPPVLHFSHEMGQPHLLQVPPTTRVPGQRAGVHRRVLSDVPPTTKHGRTPSNLPSLQQLAEWMQRRNETVTKPAPALNDKSERADRRKSASSGSTNLTSTSSLSSDSEDELSTGSSDHNVIIAGSLPPQVDTESNPTIVMEMPTPIATEKPNGPRDSARMNMMGTLGKRLSRQQLPC